MNSRTVFGGNAGFAANPSGEWVSTTMEENAAVSYLRLRYTDAEIGVAAVDSRMV